MTTQSGSPFTDARFAADYPKLEARVAELEAALNLVADNEGVRDAIITHVGGGMRLLDRIDAALTVVLVA